MIARYIYIRLESDQAENRDEIASHTLETLRALPGVVSVAVGTPADDHAEAAWDVSAEVRFESLDDVEAYRVHPDHRRFVAEYLAPRMAVIKAWNFTVTE